MKRNIPIVLALAALLAPSSALAGAAGNQYNDPFSKPKVKHHKKHAKHKKHKSKKHTRKH